MNTKLIIDEMKTILGRDFSADSNFKLMKLARAFENAHSDESRPIEQPGGIRYGGFDTYNECHVIQSELLWSEYQRVRGLWSEWHANRIGVARS